MKRNNAPTVKRKSETQRMTRKKQDSKDLWVYFTKRSRYWVPHRGRSSLLWSLHLVCQKPKLTFGTKTMTLSPCLTAGIFCAHIAQRLWWYFKWKMTWNRWTELSLDASWNGKDPGAPFKFTMCLLLGVCVRAGSASVCELWEMECLAASAKAAVAANDDEECQKDWNRCQKGRYNSRILIDRIIWIPFCLYLRLFLHCIIYSLSVSLPDCLQNQRATFAVRKNDFPFRQIILCFAVSAPVGLRSPRMVANFPYCVFFTMFERSSSLSCPLLVYVCLRTSAPASTLDARPIFVWALLLLRIFFSCVLPRDEMINAFIFIYFCLNRLQKYVV